FPGWHGLHPIGRGSATIFVPHTRLRVAVLTKLQHSLYAAARHLAGPALDGTFTAKLAWARSLWNMLAITTWTFVSSMTGLSPAALSALWAAHLFKPIQTYSNLEF